MYACLPSRFDIGIVITAKDLEREGEGEGYEPSKGSFCPLTAVNGIAAKGFHGTRLS